MPDVRPPRPTGRGRGAPELVPGTWFNTDRPLAPGAVAGQVGAAGLLDRLLRQLPAHRGRAAPARAEVPRQPGGDRRALAEVRARAGGRDGARRGRAQRDRASGAQRPPAGAVAPVRGQGLADARAHRSGRLRGRPGGRRGPGQRAGHARSPTSRRTTRCATATSRTARRHRSRAPCGSPPRRSCCRPGTCWSQTPATTSSSSWRASEVVRRIGDGTRGRTDDPLRFAEPNGLALLDDDVWSSPIPPITCCAGCGRPTACSCAPSISPRNCATRARSPARSRRCSRRGTWRGGRRSASWSSPRPACTCCSPSTPTPVRPRCSPAPRSRACATARRSTAGWPSRPDSRSTVTGCGSSTPRPRHCAISPPTARCTPSWARGCSTSGTWTARPPPLACSIRSGSRCSPTARSRCSTPTTARYAATTRPPTR